MSTLTKMESNADLETNRPYVSPPVDIYETKEAYVLEADMPGVNKHGLEILLEGNELTLIGHREVPPPVGDVVHWIERRETGWVLRGRVLISRS